MSELADQPPAPRRANTVQGPLRVYDLEGTDITSRVVSLHADANRCIATVLVKDDEGRYRHYGSNGAPATFEVRVLRIEGRWTWAPPDTPMRRLL